MTSWVSLTPATVAYVIAFALRFETVVFFTVLDLEASFSFALLHEGLFARAGVRGLSAPLSGLPLQKVDDCRPIATGTELHGDFCGFCGTAEVSQDVLDVDTIDLPLVFRLQPLHCYFVTSPSHFTNVHT